MPWVLNIPVLHRVSIEKGTSYMFDRVSSIPQILSMLGFEYTRFVNIPRLHKVVSTLF